MKAENTLQRPSTDSGLDQSRDTVVFIIPIFKHPVFLVEALTSALNQADIHPEVILVDDGCPFVETIRVCRAFARVHNNVSYVRKKNGGLSSARNTGIEYCLKFLPHARAVYFLDADNRLATRAAIDGLEELNSNPKADWVYPNINKFGMHWAGNYSTPYSVLLHIAYDNICEAGSLVSLRMLRSGLRFDEAMRSGYEDWEFWLSAVSKGFRGVPSSTVGFDYRQRPESMLSNSNRERAAILAYIKTKHRQIFTPASLLQFEHSEAPRYLQIDLDSFRAKKYTDPRRPSTPETLESFSSELWRTVAEPDSCVIPHFWYFLSSKEEKLFGDLKIKNNVLFQCEIHLRDAHFLRLVLESGQHASISVAEYDRSRIGVGWFTNFETAIACISDPDDTWLKSLASDAPQPTVKDLVINVATTLQENDAAAESLNFQLLLLSISVLKNSGKKIEKKRWTWQNAYLPSGAHRHQLLRDHFSVAAMSNLLKKEGVIDIAFVLPFVSFGGVEKVAYALAQQLNDKSVRCHLFVMHGASSKTVKASLKFFDTINFFDENYELWGGSARYLGQELALAHDAPAQAHKVIGLLLGMDVIINSHVAPLNAVLGDLRRLGCKTVGHLHVIDQSRWGREVGHPYNALAFEHAYDAIMVCSNKLGQWMHAMGVPREKITHVPNAPSFEAKHSLDHIIQRRTKVDKEELTAIFMGRLDRQKGVDVLIEVVARTRRSGLPIKWRIVGASIIDVQLQEFVTQALSELDLKIEPAVMESGKIGDLLLGADVLVLPSRWEGAPLSVLEAQMYGCIPIVTDVGANEEIVEDNVDGCVVDGSEFTQACSSIFNCLERLAFDSVFRRTLAVNSIERAKSRSWHSSAEKVKELVRSWFPNVWQ